jgi:hypothetical protein
VATCGDPQKLIDAISHSDAVAPGLSYELVDYRCVADYGCAHVFAKSVVSASVILQRENGSWRVLDLGSAVNRSLVPADVGAELGIPSS